MMHHTINQSPQGTEQNERKKKKTRDGNLQKVLCVFRRVCRFDSILILDMRSASREVRIKLENAPFWTGI